jgi:DNA-binding transcriptional MerR regulator
VAVSDSAETWDTYLLFKVAVEFPVPWGDSPIAVRWSPAAARIGSSETPVARIPNRDPRGADRQPSSVDRETHYYGILAVRPAYPGVTTAEIPNRSLFRQPEVCEIAQVQPYVLRSWEAEFPDLGVSKTEGGPRVYRRADLEFVLRIKHLLFVDGLTLAGARRKLLDERPASQIVSEDIEELLGTDARERLLLVKRGLKEIALMLAKQPSAANGSSVPASLFDLVEPRTPAASKKSVKKTAASKKKK